MELDPDGNQSRDMLELLRQSDVVSNLFPTKWTGHTPFPDGIPFSGSFFNIFHYDYGLLNHHRDRYLVTVVAADIIPSATPKTALWVNSPTQGWINLDDRLEPGDIAIFTGEDFEELSSTLGAPFRQWNIVQEWTQPVNASASSTINPTQALPNQAIGSVWLLSFPKRWMNSLSPIYGFKTKINTRCLHSKYCFKWRNEIFEAQKSGYKVVNEVNNDVDAIGCLQEPKSPDTFDVDYPSDVEDEQTNESDTGETEDTGSPSEENEEEEALSCDEGFELFEFCTGIDLSESHTCTETLYNELELMQYLTCETFLTAQEELPLCESLGINCPEEYDGCATEPLDVQDVRRCWNGPIPQP